MALTYPSITPSTRKFTVASFNPTLPNFHQIIEYPRLWSQYGIEAKLRLGYEKISDANAASIITCWLNSKSGFVPLVLPTIITAGTADSDLLARIRDAAHLEWRFETAPTQRSSIPGRSDVTVSLSAEARLG